jgi:hypothetical protein
MTDDLPEDAVEALRFLISNDIVLVLAHLELSMINKNWGYLDRRWKSSFIDVIPVSLFVQRYIRKVHFIVKDISSERGE